MEALGLLDLMDHYGAMPDVVTFGAAISACAKDGQWQKALTLLDVAQVLNIVLRGSRVGGWP